MARFNVVHCIASAFISMVCAMNFVHPRNGYVEPIQHKYAVAESWIVEKKKDNEFDRGPKGVDSVTHMSCPIVLSLQSAAAMARKALPNSTKNTTSVDRVFYTEKAAIGERVVQFMESRGIRVVDMQNDPIMRSAERTPGMPAKGTHNYANMRKLQFLWDTNYDAILLTDYDVIFPMTPRSPVVDMLSTVALGEKSMYTFRGARCPVAGGIVAVRPGQEFGTIFLRAMQHGFSYQEGWGGKYSMGATNSSLMYYKANCEHPEFEFDYRCCAPKVPTLFCTSAAYLDQGMLFHLAVDGEQDRRVASDKHWEEVGAKQFTMWPKPWNTHLLDVALEKGRMNLFDEYWKNWKDSLSDLLGDDDECSTFFNKMFDLYNVCYKQFDPTTITAEQVKACIAEQLL